MDEAELVIRRSQMGKSARSFVTAGPDALDEQAAGYWLALSGAPSPDLNVAFVDSGDPTVLEHALRVTEGSGFPSLFVLAGACRDSDLGARWQHVGEMPFMIRTLQGEDLRLDSLAGREQAVLRGILSGLTNRKIADRLGLSEAAVKATLQQLFDKTGVRTRSQLVRIMLADGNPVEQVSDSLKPQG